MPPVSVNLHSESLRHHFAHQQGFDVFGLIEVARAQGFDGVGIATDGPGFKHLGGTDSGHFANVRDALVANELAVELHTSDTRPQPLHLLLEVASALGADALRTYTRHRGTPHDMLESTVSDLRIAAERAEITGVRILLGNCDDFLAHELAEIVQRVGSKFVHALFDYGNSQVVGEDPLAALQALLPFVDGADVKDQLIISDAGKLRVQGVATGEGKLPIEEITRRLHAAGCQRFCFKSAWSLVSPLSARATVLPESPCFVVQGDSVLVDGAQLDPESAVEGERLSLQRGWNWFNAVLAVITGTSRFVLGDWNDRDKAVPGIN